MSKFLPTSGFKWIDPKEFDLDNYTTTSSKGCVFEINLEYPEELRELHNDYLLAPDKIEIKREMVSEYQLKIANLYNIPIGNVVKFRIKTKKSTSRTRIQSMIISKTIYWIQRKRNNRSRKIGGKMEKRCTN